MTVNEALTKAISILNTCNVCVRDARKLCEVMELIEGSINALSDQQTAPTDKKEESK